MLWGISYANLMMMLSDQVTTLYSFDKKDKEMVDADDPRNAEAIKRMYHG